MCLWILLILFSECMSEIWHNQNGKSYFTSPDSLKTNFQRARSACEARDSILAVVTNIEDNNSIARNTTRDETYFIGLTGPDDCEPPASDACRQRWGWIDGTVSNYTNWAGQRPFPDRGCGVFRAAINRGSWDAASCSSVRKYICQRECSPEDCERSECYFDTGLYLCMCKPDYTGVHCDTKIDDCESNPCLHGASCTDGVRSFTCHCILGFTGVNCEINIDECISNPCINGSCEDYINGYRCNCYDGFQGTLCEVNINECESNPCRHGGTCVDLIDGYGCLCADKYVDKLCNPHNDQYKSTVIIVLSVMLGLFMLGCGTAMAVALIFYKRRKTQPSPNYETYVISQESGNENSAQINQNYSELQHQQMDSPTADEYSIIENVPSQ